MSSASTSLTGSPEAATTSLPLARFLRRHGLILALVAAGAVLRFLTMLAYQPAMEFVQDSFDYLHEAQQMKPGIVRPLGYPTFLRVLSTLSRRLEIVPLVQHGMALGIAVLIYLLLTRLGVLRWLAALAAAPMLLDGYQIFVEQFVLAESLFEFLVVLALVLVLWSRRPTPLACAGAGALVAAAGLTRSLGSALLVPLVAYLIVRRLGVKRVVAAVVPAVVVLVGYATWFHEVHGRFGIGAYDGYFLAGRVAPIADCEKLQVAPTVRALCDGRPKDQRLPTDAYIFSPDSPLRRVQVPPGTDRNANALAFAKAVIGNQPGDYVRTATTDVLHYFSPLRTTNAQNYPVEMLRFRTEFKRLPWQPQYPPSDPYLWQWSWPGEAVSFGTVVAAHGFDLEREYPSLNEPLAKGLRAYQRVGFTPGPLLAVCLILSLVAGVGRLPEHLRSARWNALLLSACGLVMLTVPSFAVLFDYRFILPTLALFPPAGAVALTLLRDRKGAWDVTPDTAAPRAPVGESSVPVGTSAA